MADREGPDDYIALAHAAELCGLSAGTLRNQALNGRLQTVKLAGNHVTTRRWLHAYLVSRGDTNGRAAPLPADYRAPE